MKKNITTAIVLGIISISVFGQGGTATNIRLGSNFLGFSSGVPGDLQIRNNLAAQPINFFAGGATAGFQRMTVLGTNGFVGIGNTSAYTPQSLLHLNRLGPTATHEQFTNGATGNATPNDGFKVGLSFLGDAELRQQETKAVNFFSDNTQRMTIFDAAGSPTNAGFVGIGKNFTTPSSLLHVNGFNNSTGLVFRTDGDGTKENNWRLLTRNLGPNYDEKFKIFVPSNDNDAHIQSSAGAMVFNVWGLDPVSGLNAVVERARFTTGNTMATVNGQNYDGFRIFTGGFNNQQAVGSLDMWVGPSNTVFIRMDGGGALRSESNRLELCGNNRGLWYNAKSIPNANNFEPRHIFNIDSTEVARISPYYLPTSIVPAPEKLGFYRIGLNPTNLDAARRLEVFDNFNNPQFRITQSQATVYTDFQTTSLGDLFIDPHNDAILQNVGISTSTPGNKLEINSNLSYNSGVVGYSGLRFTDLKSGSLAVINGTNGVDNTQVLSVDQDGDVVLVEAGGGSANIGSCTSPTLLSSGSGGGIDLNGGNFIFSNSAPGVGTGNVGIGLSGCGTLAKLQVQTSTESYVIKADYTGSATSGGAVYGSFTNGDGHGGDFYGGRYGAYGLATSGSGVNHTGVIGQATGGSGTNIGTEGYAIGASGNRNVGVHGTASGGSSYNIGVHGDIDIENQDTPGYWAGYFDGNVTINGNIVGTGTDSHTSDSKFKTNVADISNATEIISQLIPHTFNFDVSGYPSFNFPSGKQYGLIAQEVETVLPELVSDNIHPEKRDTAGNVIAPEVQYKALNYNAFIAILLQGMKEQQAQIDSMKNILSQLPNGWGNGNRHSANQEVTIKDVELGGNTVILEQNVPNPFAEETTINYFIPDDVKFAQVLFYDNLGRVIKTVDIKEKGKGLLNVFASNLGDGIYSYTLVVDGKTVDTKKMVKTK